MHECLSYIKYFNAAIIELPGKENKYCISLHACCEQPTQGGDQKWWKCRSNKNSNNFWIGKIENDEDITVKIIENRYCRKHKDIAFTLILRKVSLSTRTIICCVVKGKDFF